MMVLIHTTLWQLFDGVPPVSVTLISCTQMHDGYICPKVALRKWRLVCLTCSIVPPALICCEYLCRSSYDVESFVLHLISPWLMMLGYQRFNLSPTIGFCPSAFCIGTLVISGFKMDRVNRSYL